MSPWRIATFANLYVVLTTYYPDNPGITDWLGLGRGSASPLGVTIFAARSTSPGFVWIAWQLRDRAVATDWPATSRRPGSPRSRSGAAGRRTALGLEPPGGRRRSRRRPRSRWRTGPRLGGQIRVAAAAARLARAAAARRARAPRLVRARAAARAGLPDRSARARGEPGGRFDRLDLWLLVVLVVVALVLRTFRLDEPYSMHFDEVYHARTATEFLQDWRYGEPHDIYEYTHPHLAKYAMAAGHRGVRQRPGHRPTADLGRAGARRRVEPRWDDAGTARGRAGDRLYVATGDRGPRLRPADRALRSAPAPLPGASAVAVDQTWPSPVRRDRRGRASSRSTPTVARRSASEPGDGTWRRCSPADVRPSRLGRRADRPASS